MKKTILKPISNSDGNDGFIGYHFDDLESAQKKCTEFTNCAGVTYLPIYSQYEPRFGPPSQSDKHESLPYLHETKRNEWSWTKDPSCEHHGQPMDRTAYNYQIFHAIRKGHAL